jgi:hypothetical protein
VNSPVAVPVMEEAPAEAPGVEELDSEEEREEKEKEEEEEEDKDAPSSSSPRVRFGSSKARRGGGSRVNFAGAGSPRAAAPPSPPTAAAAVTVEEEDEDEEDGDGMYGGGGARVVTLRKQSSPGLSPSQRSPPALPRRATPAELAAAREAAPGILEGLRKSAAEGPAKPLLPVQDLGGGGSGGGSLMRALRLSAVAERGERALAAFTAAWEAPREGIPNNLANSVSIVAAASVLAAGAAAMVLAIKRGYI